MNSLTIIKYESTTTTLSVTNVNGRYEIRYIPKDFPEEVKVKYVRPTLDEALEIFHDLLFKESVYN